MARTHQAYPREFRRQMVELVAGEVREDEHEHSGIGDPRRTIRRPACQRLGALPHWPALPPCGRVSANTLTLLQIGGRAYFFSPPA